MRLAFLLFCSLITASAGATTWHEHYAKGLELIASGDGAAAQDELEAALRQRPEAGLGVGTEGRRTVDYLPNLYLAIAAQMSGDLETARAALTRAEEAGVAAGSLDGQRLLEAYRILLQPAPAAAPPAPPAEPQPDYARYERAPPVLSERELGAVRQEVRQRCGLGPDADAAKTPWYFYYELGLELERRGDPQRALDALVEASLLRPQSQRAARMYGMWFIDYRPYFEIAKLHWELGNTGCAEDALRVSEANGELVAGDAGYDELLSLKRGLTADSPQP